MISPFKAAIDLFQWCARKDDRYVIEVMKMNRSLFTDDFCDWLPTNLHVFGEFCSRARSLVRAGRKHYSGKTIIEVIRYNTDIKQNGKTSWKLNNTHTSYLVRLCELVYPETNGLFEKRITYKTIRESATKSAMEEAI